MPTHDEMESIAREFNDRGISAHDLDYISGKLSEDFVEHNPFPGLGHDKQGALDTFKALFAATPDAKGEIIRLVIDGTKMAIHTRVSGTDNGTGQMPGVPPTGKSYTADTIDVVVVDDEGRFVEHYGIFDVPAAMMQLGLMEPPPAPG